MQKKPNSRGKFDITNKNQIADLQQSLIDVETKYPIVFDFLEDYCGFLNAVLSSDPYDISYAGGKRDVILTIKTIMRRDITAEQIAEHYKKNL